MGRRAIKTKEPRSLDDLSSIERCEIIQAFKRDYLGQGIVNQYRLTREAFRQLRELSRL